MYLDPSLIPHSRELRGIRKCAGATAYRFLIIAATQAQHSSRSTNAQTQLTPVAGKFSLACARCCAYPAVTCFTSDWFQVLSSGIPIASLSIMRITMTLTRRNGQLVPLGQNEALRILLARSDHENRQDFYSHSEQSFFGRLLRIFVAVAQTAFPLHR
jgi:hypothetical protein